MVTDLDFEEIDDIMGQIDDTRELTNAIATDVAKVSPAKKAKKTQSKSTAKKKEPVKVKNENQEPSTKSKVIAISDTAPKDKPIKKAPKPISKPKPEPKNESEGEKILVRVLTKYVEEPEEPIYKPNPKTGRFMDMVGPKNDMTIMKKQPNIPIPVTTVVETSETVIETVENVDIEPEASDDDYDRNRIEKNGLDPDATVEEMTELSEPEDGDEFLEEVISLLGEDIEEESNEPSESEKELEAIGDILDIPDRSDVFLSEVEIEKRPLGSNTEEPSAVPKQEIAKEPIVQDKPKEQVSSKKELSRKERKQLKKNKEKQAQMMQSQPKKKGKAGKVLLYISLILLLIILGGTLGTLAYFSGLF